MIFNKIEEVKELLKNSEKIVIVSHKNPDGDAIGSSLALYHHLRFYTSKITVMMPNEMSGNLIFLPGTKQILLANNNTEIASTFIEHADLIFCLDFNALHRAGDFLSTIIGNAKAKKIMIDHHLEPVNFADYMFSDTTASSTCEMIFDFIDNLGEVDKLTKESATCIYAGMVTDTGSFRYVATTSKTHHVAYQLYQKGIDAATIQNSLFNNMDYNRLKFIGHLINKRMHVHPELKMAYITVPMKDREKYNFIHGELDGIVNYGLGLKGIEFAVLFAETVQSGIKISFRSTPPYTVNTFARDFFNGGGHANASGGQSYKSLDNTIKEFMSQFPLFLKTFNK